MKQHPLKKFLIKKKQSARSFSMENGFNYSTILLYFSGSRHPRYKKMLSIEKATDGKVLAESLAVWHMKCYKETRK